MKIAKKSIVPVLFIAALFSVILNLAFAAPLWVGFSISLAASFVTMPKGVAFMGLSKEIWRNDIVEGLWKDNQFAQYAVNADSFVLGGTVVHIPVAGTPTGVTKNLNVFPATATERSDSELTYALDTYYALPRRVAQIDKYELSYDKRQSVIGEDLKKLNQVANSGLLFNWGPLVAQTILTTGTLSGAEMIDATATGQRRFFTKDDFMKVVKMWDGMDMIGQRIALLTSKHYYQFINSLSDAERTDVGRLGDLKSGIFGEYLGVKILKRSSVLRYRGADGSYVKVDEQDAAFAANAADRAASLFYTDTCVERALGDVEVFDNPGQALYYGDIFSAMVRMGGRIRRTAGVIAAVEANV